MGGIRFFIFVDGWPFHLLELKGAFCDSWADLFFVNFVNLPVR